MILETRKTFSALTGVVLGMLALITTFQNCSTQDFSNTLSQGSKDANGINESNAGSIPFAYEFKVNQISYMSCSHSGDKEPVAPNRLANPNNISDPNVFYTFKVGAYTPLPNESLNSNAGLSLRTAYLDYMKTTFSTNGSVPDKTIQDSLAYGTAHTGAALQIAIRNDRNLTAIIGAPMGQVTFSLLQNVLLDKTEFLPQLSALFNSSNRPLTSLGTSSEVFYRMETALHFEQDSLYQEYTAETLRSSLTTTAHNLLALTYSENLRDIANKDIYHKARSVTTDENNRVWGTGFRVKFATDSRVDQGQRVIGEVIPIDLSKLERTTDSWSCPDAYRFMIMSPQDPVPGMGGMLCQDMEENSLDPAKKVAMKRVRRHLPAAEWGVNLDQRCVFPKNNNFNCYANRAFKEVQYSTGKCGISGGIYLDKSCAEFVSFCFLN